MAGLVASGECWSGVLPCFSISRPFASVPDELPDMSQALYGLLRHKRDQARRQSWVNRYRSFAAEPDAKSALTRKPT